MSDVAALLSCHPDNLGKALTTKGLWRYDRKGRRPHNRRDDLPDDEIVSRYSSGESVLSLAASLGVERIVIDRILRARCVPLRNRSAANYIRMARLTAEERSKLAEAAHAAVRGVKHTASFRIQRAIQVEAGAYITKGPGEQEIFERLVEAGFSPRQQAAIGRYNVDLTFGTVAVEVKYGTTGRFSAVRSAQRNKEIIEAGYKIAVVCLRDPGALTALDEVVALLQIVNRQPASSSQYWMIRSGFQKSPMTRFNGHKRAAVEAPPELVTSIRKIDFR